MNISHCLLLAKQGLHRSVLSASGVLFLVFYGIIWFFFFNNTATEQMNRLSDPDTYSFLTLFIDKATANSLFIENSPFLSVFFVVVLFITPGFVMWGAGDQTASDTSNRYMRFLMPRSGRFEIFIGRFFGSLAFTLLVQLSVCLVALIIAVMINQGDYEVVSYSIRIMVAVIAYTISFVAFMALLAALTGSTAIAVLIAFTLYAVLVTITGLLSRQFPALEVLSWLMPSVLKGYLLVGSTTQFLTAIVGLFAYSVVYMVLGWIIFRSRDI